MGARSRGARPSAGSCARPGDRTAGGRAEARRCECNARPAEAIPQAHPASSRHGRELCPRLRPPGDIERGQPESRRRMEGRGSPVGGSAQRGPWRARCRSAARGGRRQEPPSAPYAPRTDARGCHDRGVAGPASPGYATTLRASASNSANRGPQRGQGATSLVMSRRCRVPRWRRQAARGRPRRRSRAGAPPRRSRGSGPWSWSAGATRPGRPAVGRRPGGPPPC